MKKVFLDKWLDCLARLIGAKAYLSLDDCKKFDELTVEIESLIKKASDRHIEAQQQREDNMKKTTKKKPKKKKTNQKDHFVTTCAKCGAYMDNPMFCECGYRN